MSEYKCFSLGVRCKLYIDIYLHLTPNSNYPTLQLGCTTRFVNLQKEDTIDTINKLKALNIENIQSLPNDKLCFVINFTETLDI